MGDTRPLFSVVVPIKDENERALDAICSVVAQALTDLEIVIVDRDATAATLDAIRPCLADNRTRLIKARAISRPSDLNCGLLAASGDFIAYLEPGACWAPDFLMTMAAALKDDGLDCAYGRTDFRWGDRLLGHRGGPFDWQACLEADLIPLSAFCHRRDLFHQLGGFDEAFPIPGWDLVLRFTKRSQVAYSAASRCEYRDLNAIERLTGSPLPHAWSTLARARNIFDLFRKEQRGELARKLSLTFAIKISSVRGQRYRPYREWGDYQFADALKEALERLGHKVFIDPTWDWYEPRREPDDVVVVIRGLFPHDPQPQSINLLWNINHAEDVLPEEYESYDVVYVGSQSYAELLATFIETPVLPLLQATDPRRFQPLPTEGTVPGDVIFIGNARGEYRRMVRWAIEEGLNPAIYGTGWAEFAPHAVVRDEFIDNRDLARFYAGARVVLNDHFESMRDFGFVSNRVYDVVASGGTLVSDHFPSVVRLFGGAVRTVVDRAGLKGAVEETLARPRSSSVIAEAAEKVARQHNFDERAKAIVGDVLERLGLVEDGDPDQWRATRQRRGLMDEQDRVHTVVRMADGSPDDAAFTRLIAPLTDDGVDSSFSFGDDADQSRLCGCSVCVVQVGAVRDRQHFDALLAGIGRHGSSLVVDVDRDSLSAIDIDVMRRADQIWFATPRLLAANGIAGVAGHVVPAGIEPRFWKEYPPRSPRLTGDRPLHLLLVDRSGAAEDIAFLWSALDSLGVRYPGAFTTTVIGATSPSRQRPWLHDLSPPVAAKPYPRFASWLRCQGPFHVGLVPSGNQSSELRLLEFSAMGLLTVISDGAAFTDGSELGGLAVMAANQPDAWFEALARILDDPTSFMPVAESAVAHTWSARTNDRVALQQVQLMERLRAS